MKSEKASDWVDGSALSTFFITYWMEHIVRGVATPLITIKQIESKNLNITHQE